MWMARWGEYRVGYIPYDTIPYHPIRSDVFQSKPINQSIRNENENEMIETDRNDGAKEIL